MQPTQFWFAKRKVDKLAKWEECSEKKKSAVMGYLLKK